MISTTKNNPWREIAVTKQNKADHELIFKEDMQTIDGFGGCFNELGMIAAKTLCKADQETLFNELFKEQGCALSIGRISFGANDFSESWYSYDEI